MFERASAPKRIVFHRFSRKGQRALRPAARVCNALLPVTGAALFAWGCGAALALRTPLEAHKRTRHHPRRGRQGLL